MKLENKIKEEFENYEIKTSSNDILEKYQQKQTKRSFNFALKPLAIGFAAIALLIYPASKLITPSSSSTSNFNSIYLENHSTNLSEANVISRTALELYLGGLMSSSSSNTQKLKRFSNKISDQDFNYAKEKYKEASSLIDNIYSKNEEGLKSIYETTSFVYEEKEYTYKLTVEDFILYSQNDFNKDEFNDNILLSLNNNFYYGSLEIENEEDEVEVNLTYKDGNKVIEIEKEQEKDEFSLEYEIRENGKVISSSEIEFEYDHQGELEIEYTYLDQDENFSIKILDENNIYQDIEFINIIKQIKFEMIYNKENQNFELKQ